MRAGAIRTITPDRGGFVADVRQCALRNRAASAPLDTAKLPTAQRNQLFEITLEPATGSPTGRPTGPILYKGLAANPL